MTSLQRADHPPSTHAIEAISLYVCFACIDIVLLVATGIVLLVEYGGFGPILALPVPVWLSALHLPHVALVFTACMCGLTNPGMYTGFCFLCLVIPVAALDVYVVVARYYQLGVHISPGADFALWILDWFFVGTSILYVLATIRMTSYYDLAGFTKEVIDDQRQPTADETETAFNMEWFPGAALLILAKTQAIFTGVSQG